MFGIFNIDKPAGMTSRDVVNRVQRLVRSRNRSGGSKRGGVKVGHIGTLDPLATGVLVVSVGQATRLTHYAHHLPKSYQATFLLGRHSASDDVESHVELLMDPPVPSRSEVEDVLRRFRGTIKQRPPAYSAIKVQGRRAYDLARSGEEIVLEERDVVIHDLSVLHFDYPELVLDVECGSGTYIRSLGRDIAESLGTAAVMSALQRTSIGDLRVENAIDLESLENDLEGHLLDPANLVQVLPSITLTDAEIDEIRFGRSISLQGRRPDPPQFTTGEIGGELAAFDRNQVLVAILFEKRPGELSPVRNL